MRTIEPINLICKTANDLTDVVEHIRFRVSDITVINGEARAVSTTQMIRLAAPNAEEFVAFSSLTEAAVVAWIEAIVDIDGIVDQLIVNENMRWNPISVTVSPPWN